MIGALVFLGCPWRAYLRLSGGDWNAIPGIIGLFAGIGLGVFFLRTGFSLGRNRPALAALGWVMPALMVGLLLLLVVAPLFGRDANGQPVGPIFFSTTGPGSQHAALLISLGVGLLIGFLAQRSRFCTVGALRDLILTRDAHLFWGILALIVAAFLTNLALGQFKPGFAGQPVAQNDALWNFDGLVLAGWPSSWPAAARAASSSCPAKGMVTPRCSHWAYSSARPSHNFNLASSAAGPSPYGPAAVILGLIVCAVIGLTMRERTA